MKSILKNQNAFIAVNSLDELFDTYLGLDDVEFGEIRTMYNSGNRHSPFYYNVSEKVQKEFHEFNKNFGYNRRGEFAFFAYNQCCCSSGDVIYFNKIHPNYLKSDDDLFLEWFSKNKHEDFTGIQSARFNRYSKEEYKKDSYKYRSILHSIWDDRIRLVNDIVYTPYQVCDKYIYSEIHGCYAPTDAGYIKRDK